MRFIHTADWHLGAYNQPAVYHTAIDKLLSQARQSDISVILVVGDIFDKPNPRQETKDELLGTILNNPDILFVFTIGNHDYATKARAYHSLITFGLLEGHVKNVYVCSPGVHIIKNPALKGIPIWVLPDTLAEATALAPQTLAQLQKCATVIAAWHGIIPGFDVKTSDTTACVSVVQKLLEDLPISYLALGDIHKQLELHPQCWYPGALTQKTYGCQSGFIEVNLADAQVKATPFKLDLPERVNIALALEPNDTEHTIIALVQKEVPAGNLVRLKFQLPMSVWARLDRAAIHDALAKEFLEVRLHNDPVLESRGRENMVKLANVKTVQEELDILIGPDMLDLDRDRLLQTCLRFL